MSKAQAFHVAHAAPENYEHARVVGEINRECREMLVPSVGHKPRGLATSGRAFARKAQEQKIHRVIKRLRQKDHNAPRDLKRALAEYGLSEATSFGLSENERIHLQNIIARGNKGKRRKI